MPVDVLHQYVGTYASSRGTGKISLVDGKYLALQYGDHPPVRLRPISATEFLLEDKDARITFISSGAVTTGLTFKQDGQVVEAKRTGD